MRLRKALVIVLTVAMVLGSVATFAAAATPSDVVGTQYASAVNRLNALGVLAGYPDGTFQPANNITRAEFAKVVVAALGLSDAATIAAGPTNFADVAADHWASGYVNIATTKGILKGYPDGTFKPGNNVTYAEAITMLVRALGYEPLTVGPWPTNMITKAVELGLTSGIAMKAGDPATRGNIARMTDTAVVSVNLVTATQYTDKVVYTVSSDKLATQVLGMTEADGVLVLSDIDTNSTLTADQFVGVDATQVATGTPATYTRASADVVNPADVLGKVVNLGVKNGKLIFVNVKSTSDQQKTGTLASDFTYGTSSQLSVTVGSDTSATVFSLATGGYAGISNWRPLSSGNTVAAATNYGVNLTLDSAGKVLFADFTKYDVADKVISALEVKGQGDYTANKISTEAGAVTDLASNLVMIKDGKRVSFGDLAKGDVVNYTIDPGSVTTVSSIVATTSNVTGQITGVNRDATNKVASVVIGGTTYKFTSNATYTSSGTDQGGVWADTTGAGFETAALGTTAKLRLNIDGKVRVADLSPTSNTVTGYVLKAADAKSFIENGAIVTRDYLKVLTTTGETKEILGDVNSTSVVTAPTSTTTDPAVGDVVTLNLNSGGYATSVASGTLVNASSTITISGIDTSSKRIDFSDSTSAYYSDASAIFDETGADAAVANASALAKGLTVRKMISSSLGLSKLVIAASNTIYGVVTKVYATNDSVNGLVYKMDVVTKDGAKTYKRADSFTPGVSNLIDFKLASGGMSSTNDDLTTAAAVYNISTTNQTFEQPSATTWGVTPSTVIIVVKANADGTYTVTNGTFADIATTRNAQPIQDTSVTSSVKIAKVVVVRY